MTSPSDDEQFARSFENMGRQRGEWENDSETSNPLLAAEINELPERVRQYIHDLETNADPAGDKWRILALEQNVSGLTAEIERLRALIRRWVLDGWSALAPHEKNSIAGIAGSRTAVETKAALQVTRHAVECKCGKKFLTLEVGLDHVENCQGERAPEKANDPPRRAGHIYSPREGTEVCGICGFHKREHAPEHMAAENGGGGL